MYAAVVSAYPHLINAFQVIITTYHTLMGDFQIPKDVATEEEAEWLADNGCAAHPAFHSC